MRGLVAPGFEDVAAAFAECVPEDAAGGSFAAYVDGVAVLDVVAGSADPDRRWEPDTTCLIASGTKGIVATAMLMLIERGRLDLDEPVAAYWPEFAAAGKGAIRVADIVSHTARARPVDRHPPERAARTARLRPSADYQLSAFLGDEPPDPRLAHVYGNPPIVGRMSDPPLLACEVPGGNGVATASAMARLYGCLARGGELDGVRLMAPETVELGRREISCGIDPLSGRLLRFGVGFEVAPNPSALGPADDAFGHTGAGGSSHGAWPSRRVGFSFVTSELRPEDDDGRARRVLAALDRCVNGS